MELAPTLNAHDRFIDFCGTCNARDLGGLPLAAGGLTRRGRLFRADAPLNLEPSDADTLRHLGVTTVLDLRDPDERLREPNALGGIAGIAVHHVDVWSGLRAAAERPRDRWDLTALYVAAFDHAGSAFAGAVELLADSEGAALFHCTAGKDRTGLLAALLLEAAGVPRASVVADYALTHDRIEGVRARLLAQGEQRGFRREDFARLLGAAPGILGHALDHLDRHHGGAESYLSAAGVRASTLAKVRGDLAA